MLQRLFFRGMPISLQRGVNISRELWHEGMLDTKKMMTNELFPSLNRKSNDSMFYIFMMWAHNFITVIVSLHSINSQVDINLNHYEVCKNLIMHSDVFLALTYFSWNKNHRHIWQAYFCINPLWSFKHIFQIRQCIWCILLTRRVVIF